MEKTKALSKQQIINLLRTNMAKIQRYKVKKLGLFGSYLKSKSHEKSDLDFLVEFEKPTFDNYMELKFLLEDLFHKKVDLVMENSLKPSLKHLREEAVYVS